MGLGRAARAAPDRAALVSAGGVVSYENFEDRQARLAGALDAGGVGFGDRIAVLSANRAEYLEVTCGALRRGVVPVPIHALLTVPEVAYIVEDSGAKWLFADRPVEAHPGLERIVIFGDAYERCLYEARPAELADVILTRPMHYTSGTTGRPKGVWVTPQNEGVATEASERFRSLWALSGDDVHLVCSPFSHSAPHRFAVRTLEAGGTVALQTKFDARETLLAISAFGVTTTFMVPTHLERVFALGERIVGRHDTSSVKLLAHAGAPIIAGTKQLTIAAFPTGSVWEFYGSTEGQATRISSDEWSRKPGSVGMPLPGTAISVRDESGEVLPPGEIGEIWITPPEDERFEYWQAPGKTDDAWSDDRFTVGDLGYIDDDGYLFLTGRKHDTIISGGVNVYPQEVEAVLGSHPDVVECIVYGVTDPEWGQRVDARVVCNSPRARSEAALREWLRERLAAYKIPKIIEFVDELPRTPTGKLMRRF